MGQVKLIWIGRIAYVADESLPEGWVNPVRDEPMRIGAAAKEFDKRITPL
jgi:hypothetical protein